MEKQQQQILKRIDRIQKQRAKLYKEYEELKIQLKQLGNA